MRTHEEMISLALELGAHQAAVVEVASIPFQREFRKACEANMCGQYGKCWMCPPDVGDIDDLIRNASTRRHALVFQSIGPLEDSYDFEGMEAAGEVHQAIVRTLREHLGGELTHFLPLGAGGCKECEQCSKRVNKPCPFPEKAMASLESYGIAVSELANLCGMKYINGENTVTYFGAFLFG